MVETSAGKFPEYEAKKKSVRKSTKLSGQNNQSTSYQHIHQKTSLGQM